MNKYTADKTISTFVDLIRQCKDDKDFRKGFMDSFFTDEGVDNFGELLRVRAIVSRFIKDQRISCAEATIEDRVYENAPTLIEELANVVGYYEYDDEDEDDDD